MEFQRTSTKRQLSGFWPLKFFPSSPSSCSGPQKTTKFLVPSRPQTFWIFPLKQYILIKEAIGFLLCSRTVENATVVFVFVLVSKIDFFKDLKFPDNFRSHNYCIINKNFASSTLLSSRTSVDISKINSELKKLICYRNRCIPPEVFLQKYVLEAMQQICRRRAMQKSDFNKVALQLY